MAEPPICGTVPSSLTREVGSPEKLGSARSAAGSLRRYLREPNWVHQTVAEAQPSSRFACSACHGSYRPEDFYQGRKGHGFKSRQAGVTSRCRCRAARHIHQPQPRIANILSGGSHSNLFKRSSVAGVVHAYPRWRDRHWDRTFTRNLFRWLARLSDCPVVEELRIHRYSMKGKAAVR